MRLARVSAIKISPFGAVLIWRGPFNPAMSNSTLKPAGTWGIADAGRGTTCETLAEEAVAPGLGRSPGLIKRTRPGLSVRQSPKAACSASVPDCTGAGTAPAAIASVAATRSRNAFPARNVIVRSPAAEVHADRTGRVFQRPDVMTRVDDDV